METMRRPNRYVARRLHLPWTLLPGSTHSRRCTGRGWTVMASNDGRVRRWQLVRVHGPSMVPTLRPGELLLIRRLAAGRNDDLAGRVVVGRFRDLPAAAVVKRAVAASDDGWVLRSDNPFAAGDSSLHGVADIEAVAVLRWRPGLRAPRRIGPAPQ